MGLANAIEFQQLPFNTETKIWCPTCSLEVKVHYVARDSIAIPNYGTFLHFSRYWMVCNSSRSPIASCILSE